MEARDKPFDVFISHSSADRHAASLIKQHLQSQGLRCWKAPDDILPGESWPQAILRAIGNSEVMLLVWTGNATTSQEVGKELTLAMRNNLTVVPFRLENVAATGEWEYHLANTHWMDAFDGQLEDHLGSLATYLQRVIAAKDSEESHSAENAATFLAMPTEALSESIKRAEVAVTATSDKEILSPMAGTFYTAPSPESPPFVKVGEKVKSDTVVCIIEARGMMNEIMAKVSGTITKVAVVNGRSVQFGQVLFHYNAEAGRNNVGRFPHPENMSLLGAQACSSSSIESSQKGQAPWWAVPLGFALGVAIYFEIFAFSLPDWLFPPVFLTSIALITYVTARVARWLYG